LSTSTTATTQVAAAIEPDGGEVLSDVAAENLDNRPDPT